MRHTKSILKKSISLVIAVIILFSVISISEIGINDFRINAKALTFPVDLAEKVVFNKNYGETFTVKETVSVKRYYLIDMQSSGELTLNINSDNAGISTKIYDLKEVYVWGKQFTTGWTVGREYFEEKIDLIKGTYLMELDIAVHEKYSDYNFLFNFTSSEESFEETLEKMNNTVITASTVCLGKEYRGQLAINDTDDFYKFTLLESGKISLNYSSKGIITNNISIYNEKGESLWNSTKLYMVETTEKIDFSQSFDLVSGTYYLLIKYGGQISGIDSFGNYNFNIGFVSAEESFKETQSEQNNNLSTASPIYINAEYRGQIAQNDYIDYYYFSLPEDTSVSLKFESIGMQSTGITIYNASGSHIWSNSEIKWDAVTQIAEYSRVIELKSGSYEMSIGNRYSPWTGNYKFSLNSDDMPTTKPTEPSTTKPSVTKIPAKDAEIKNPSQTTINYGDKIVLHMYVDLPEGARVEWIPSNGNFSYSVSPDGKTCTISPETSGDTTFTAYVVDKDGNIISEEYKQTMTAKAGFFQKIIAFFKSLFGLNKTIPVAVKFALK